MFRLLKYTFVLLIVFVLVIVTAILPQVRKAAFDASMPGKSCLFVFSLMASYSLSSTFIFPIIFSSSTYDNVLVPGYAFLPILKDSSISGIHLNGKDMYNTAFSIDNPSLSVSM